MSTPPADPQRILIVRPSALGDVARTVPALVSLKRAFPHAAIDWLVNDAFAPVIAAHPDLGEVVAFPRQRFRGFGRNLGVTRDVLAYLRELRGRRYDRVYDLQGLSRSGMLTWFTRAPHRAGAADAREMAWLGYTRRVPIDGSIVHTVDHMLAILQGDGVPIARDMRLYVAPDDQHWAQAFMQAHGLKPERYAVIAPTARWRSKRWPIESFAAIAARLPELRLDGCVIVGSRGEEPQVAPLLAAAGGRCVDLVGKTTVGQLMAILQRCGLLVANDSAALHIAIGLGRRSVAIFGPTDPVKVGPYRYDTGLIAVAGGDRLHYRDTTDQSVIASIGVERVWCAAQRVMPAPPPTLIHDTAATSPV